MTEEEKPNNDLDPCPDEDLLRGFAKDQLQVELLKSVVEAHLQFCARCSSKVEKLRSESSTEGFLKSQADRFRERSAMLLRGLREGPMPGTLWRAVPESQDQFYGPLLIVLQTGIGKEGGQVRVAEVSEEIEQAIHTDMILEPQESGLRFRCMVRAGNIFATGSKSLKQLIGSLPPSLFDSVLEFCQHGEFFDERVFLSEIVFLRDTHGNEFMRRRGVTSGMVAIRNDPRLDAAGRSWNQCRYLHAEESKPEKPKPKLLEKDNLISLLKGLVSRLSVGGSLLGPGLELVYPQELLETEGTVRLAARADPDKQKRDSVKIEAKPKPVREDVRKRTPKKTFRRGESINFSVSVPEQGHLLVLHYSEQRGDLEILFPSPLHKGTTVTQGQSVPISRTLSLRSGLYAFKVIFCRQELALPDKMAAKGPGMERIVIAAIEQMRNLDESDWRVATFEYEVLKGKGFFSRWF